MKSCVLLFLLTLLCPGGCPVYDLNLKSIEAPNEFNNHLQLPSDLNSEYEQSLLKVRYNDENQKDLSYGDDSQVIATETSERKPERNIPPRRCMRKKQIFVGTNLFEGIRKKCFSSEDIALLTARMDFEVSRRIFCNPSEQCLSGLLQLLIPKDLPQCLLNDKMVGVLMRYFYNGNEIIQQLDDCSRRLTEKAFFDALGGYLKWYVVPVTKYSFYAGKVCYKTVQNIVLLYEQCKIVLNTNGNGWRHPMQDVLQKLKNVQIEPLDIQDVQGLEKVKKESTEITDKSQEEKKTKKRHKKKRKNKNHRDDCTENGAEPSSCVQLDLTSINCDAEDDQMIVSLPRLEPEDCDGFLGNIWLPFKGKRSFNLRSPKSLDILVKFYETVTRCYRFQRKCQKTYNYKFKAWILENIHVHLGDDQFYPGLGGVLRIYENLRRGKKSAHYEENPVVDQEDEEDKADQVEEDDQDNKNSDEELSKDVPVKRQKTEKYNEIEHKVKQMEGKSQGWYGDNKKEAAKKEDIKNVLKKDLKQLIKLHLKYVWIALATVLGLLIIVILYCYRKKRKKRVTTATTPPSVSTYHTSTTPPSTPTKRKKGLSPYQFDSNKKSMKGETLIIVQPNSSSVIGGNTSSLPLGCSPCMSFGNKNKKPASSTDYSSSESESKSKAKGKSKGKEKEKDKVKPKKVVKSKKSKKSVSIDDSKSSEASAAKSNVANKDRLKGGKSSQSSWETTYDT